MKRASTSLMLLFLVLMADARASFEEQFIESMEEGMEIQFLLLTRANPEAAENMKPITFDSEDKEVFTCVLSRAEEQDLLGLYEIAMERSAELNAVILADPGISMATLNQHPEVMESIRNLSEIGTESERAAMQTISSECGMMTLMSDKIRESGLMRAAGPATKE